MLITSQFFSCHPVILKIFLVFFLTSLYRELQNETIKFCKIKHFFLMQPYLNCDVYSLSNAGSAGPHRPSQNENPDLPKRRLRGLADKGKGLPEEDHDRYGTLGQMSRR
jgi:hypothetical protein